MLEFIFFGNNRKSDTFPSWLGSLSQLNVLILQANHFHGVIEGSNFTFMFPKLQILDISRNSFAGKLPMEYFQCLNAMKVVTSYLRNLAYLQISFQPRWYTKILKLWEVHDLSNNSSLQVGYIPTSPSMITP